MAKPRKSAKKKPDTVEDAVVVEEPIKSEDVEDLAPAEVEAPSETAENDQADVQSESEDIEPIEGAPEASATPDAVVKEAPPARSGSVFLPLLLGGAVAAAVGFGAARYPDEWPFVTQPAVDPMAVELEALGDRLGGLEQATSDQSAQLTGLLEDPALDQLRGELSGEMAQLRTQYEGISAKLLELENRVLTVEKLPQGSGMEAAAAAATAYERELQQMRQMLDAELAQITSAQEDAQTLEVSAAQTAKAAAARAAMSRVLAALETGRAFDDALFDLTENAGVEAPQALAETAEKGVVTLSALQASYPESARAALDASVRAAVEDGSMDRVTAFFRTQLGTRSLEPKEGNDPDAILSRAEAALKDGRIDAALSELDAMPDAGKPALEAWISQATARNAALAAGETLAQQVNSN